MNAGDAVRFTSVNPATGEPVATYGETEPRELSRRLDGAQRAFEKWRALSFGERGVCLRAAAKILRDSAPEYARLMATEMGKPLRDGVAEAEKCALCCEYFAEHAARLLAPEPVDIGAARSLVAFRPLGVILAIMPWNFPFWQVFRFAAPALMAGNAAVLKHASNVSGCALSIEKIFRAAGFPEDLFSTLLVESRKVDALIEDPRIQAVTLTGSVAAGRAVARKAGEMLKKSVLELGGSDPYLILEDADLELAARVCAAGRLVNSGQSCIAAKRFIVVESVRPRFEELFVKCMHAAKVGDPLADGTQVGPMARRDLRDGLHAQVLTSIAKGARCLTGGVIPEGPSAYYPPTVLTDVHPGMPAHDEEMFGPVAAITPVKDEAQAIAAANRSIFGLGASILSRDLARAERIATESIDAGSVFVNAAVQSNPKLPFGGIKASGYGRELSHYGIKEFVNIKTIVVEEGTRSAKDSPAAGRAE